MKFGASFFFCHGVLLAVLGMYVLLQVMCEWINDVVELCL